MCNSERGATESLCLVFQEICRLHRLHRLWSVIQLFQRCTVHSVQRSRNSGKVFSMRWANSSYGSLHWVPWWRQYKPPRYDGVLLWMGMSPNGHFKSTTGGITTWLKCLFVFKAAESSIYKLLALFKTFPTGAICQTAGMVIVEVRHQPPMQPFHDESYRFKPLFFVGTGYIISVSLIWGAVHLLPLIAQPDSSQWYFTNMIDLNAFNVFYILIIRLDAWSNHCSDI